MVPISYRSDTPENELPLRVGDKIDIDAWGRGEEGTIIALQWLDGDTGDIEAIDVELDTGFKGIVKLEELELCREADEENDGETKWCMNDPCESEATHRSNHNVYLCATCANAYRWGQENHSGWLESLT